MVRAYRDPACSLNVYLRFRYARLEESADVVALRGIPVARELSRRSVPQCTFSVLRRAFCVSPTVAFRFVAWRLLHEDRSTPRSAFCRRVTCEDDGRCTSRRKIRFPLLDLFGNRHPRVGGGPRETMIWPFAQFVTACCARG